MAKAFTGFLVCILLLACGEGFKVKLDNLGQGQSFGDVDIPDDFAPPQNEDVPLNNDENVISIPIVNNKNTFFMENSVFELAHNLAQRWDGCQSDYLTQGGYNSTDRCGRAFLEERFAFYLNEYFYSCVQRSADASGVPRPLRIFINHLGSYNDRPVRGSTALSHHAYARAIDVASISLFDSDDKIFKFSALLRDYSGAQAKFYDEFRQCWREQIPETCTNSDREHLGSIGHRSSELGGNNLHNDHIHLVLPLCAGGLG